MIFDENKCQFEALPGNLFSSSSIEQTLRSSLSQNTNITLLTRQ